MEKKMRIEECELWELLIPIERSEKPFRETFTLFTDDLKGHISGHTVFQIVNGQWNSKDEESLVLRFACDRKKIEQIMSIALRIFKQECIMCYKISNLCMMGYEE